MNGYRNVTANKKKSHYLDIALFICYFVSLQKKLRQRHNYLHKTLSIGTECVSIIDKMFLFGPSEKLEDTRRVKPVNGIPTLF
jgi:hypothetical protein